MVVVEYVRSAVRVKSLISKSLSKPLSFLLGGKDGFYGFLRVNTFQNYVNLSHYSLLYHYKTMMFGVVVVTNVVLNERNEPVIYGAELVRTILEIVII